MAANPILPLYYNDIDRSTRDWTDEEFGCYMRLLMHQWAQGEIPKESQRLSRIVTSMGSSWVTVGKKFVETETGMVNEKLEEIRAERLSYQKKQIENGKKGGRKPKNNPKVNPNTNPNQSLHNEDEIENEDEKGKENYIIPKMTNLWYTEFPFYSKHVKNDSHGMSVILDYMTKQAGITDISNEEFHSKILNTLQLIADQVKNDKFWVNKTIVSIANSIQEFYNKIKNPLPNGKQHNKNGQSLREQVQAEFAKRHGTGQQAGN